MASAQRRPDFERLFDAVRRSLYSALEHTFEANREREARSGAHRATAGDLGLPGRLRRPARLPADGPRDRGGGRPRLALDRARAPREPRARRAPAARPDEAARTRA